MLNFFHFHLSLLVFVLTTVLVLIFSISDKDFSVELISSYNVGLKVGAYAFVVVDDDNMVVHRDCGVVVHVGLLAGHNIGCECKAVVEALKWCVSSGVVCDIYYDLVNLRSWVQDLWNEKPWRTNMDYSQVYRYYIMNNRQHLRNMSK